MGCTGPNPDQIELGKRPIAPKHASTRAFAGADPIPRAFRRGTIHCPTFAGASRNSFMNKTDLIQRLADQHQLSKAEAGRILDTLLDTVVASVKKGDAVTIPGFGTFKQHARAARNGVNPSTGEKIKIAAAKLPKFTPGATFRAAVDPKAAARKAGAAPAKKAGDSGRPPHYPSHGPRRPENGGAQPSRPENGGTQPSQPESEGAGGREGETLW